MSKFEIRTMVDLKSKYNYVAIGEMMNKVTRNQV